MVEGRGRRWSEKCLFIWNCLFLRQPQKPTPSQPHRPSCSSGTQCEWRRIREQTPQAWRRGSNVTQKTTQETVGTPTFQRDMWVVDTFLLTALQFANVTNTWYKVFYIHHLVLQVYVSSEWRPSKLCVATVQLKLKADADKALSCCVVVFFRWTSCLLSTRLAVSAWMRATTVASRTA